MNRLPRLALLATAAYLALVGFSSVSTAGQKADSKDTTREQEARRPKVTLRAQPVVAVSPARVVLTAELVGGSDDFEEYYCPTVEWEWGDGTRSESTTDCDPYETGKSQIKRRFRVEHLFRRPGAFKVYFHLKRKSKIITSASTTIQVRPGGGPCC